MQKNLFKRYYFCTYPVANAALSRVITTKRICAEWHIRGDSGTQKFSTTLPLSPTIKPSPLKKQAELARRRKQKPIKTQQKKRVGDEKFLYRVLLLISIGNSAETAHARNNY